MAICSPTFNRASDSGLLGDSRRIWMLGDTGCHLRLSEPTLRSYGSTWCFGLINSTTAASLDTRCGQAAWRCRVVARNWNAHRPWLSSWLVSFRAQECRRRRLTVGWTLARICFGRTGLYTSGVLEMGRTGWMGKGGKPLWSLVDVHYCFTTYLIRFNKNLFPDSLSHHEQQVTTRWKLRMEVAPMIGAKRKMSSITENPLSRRLPHHGLGPTPNHNLGSFPPPQR
jgi:hypothetical protein